VTSTAIARKKPSLPARVLKQAGLLRGLVLDYGCGYGMDAEWLQADKYDPVHYDVAVFGRYDTILCTYVLNTIRLKADRAVVLEHVKCLLKSDGRAFITVRRDVRGCERTSKGWQCRVTVPGAISLWRCNSYEIYVIGK
jgi:2-polyprenyl-3-methyl-5-hydroxy-6-metoxy-1,4-benzoquinol methylase